MSRSHTRTRRLAFALAIGLPLAALVVFFAWPVAAMLARGLGPEALGVLGAERTRRLLGTTVQLAAAGTIGSVLLGVPGAYVLYACRFPGRRALRAIATIPFVLPTVVVGVAFRSLLGRDGAYSFLGLDQTTTAIVAAMVFFNFSVVVRTVGTMWAGLDPRTADAARMLGAGPVRVFRTVTLPALRGAVASSACVVFLFCSTAYGIVVTLGGTSTLESEIAVQTFQLNLDAAAAFSFVQFALVALTLTISSRASRATAVAMRPSAEHRLRISDLPSAALTFAVVFGLIVAPMASLAVRSFRQDGQWTLANYRLLATPGKGAAGGITVVEALEHSLRAAAIATAIALAIGVPLAFALSRPTGPARARRPPEGTGAKRRRVPRGRSPESAALRAIESFAMAPLGVSAVTVGFGFIISLQGPPLYMGDELIPIAQAIIAMPMVLRALLPIMRAIDPRLRDAAAMLGASPARTLAMVDAPIMFRGLGLAVGFAFAMSLGEFGASSFLASDDNGTLPVLVSRLLARPGGGNYGMAMAASVILGLATALVMTLSEHTRERNHVPA